MKKKLIIFDLDGTLLDTIEDITYSLNYSLNSYGYNTYTKSDVISFIGSGMDMLIRRSLDKQIIFGKSYEESDFINVKDTYSKYYNNHNTVFTTPFEGIYELLSYLKEKYLIAVCSNKPEIDTLKVIEKYFPNTFDFVYGAKAPFKIKPNPGCVDYILSSLNVNKDEAILIGDSEVDIKCAHNTNIDSILCMWGYLHLEELDNITPSKVVNKPLEILEIL